MWPKGQEEAIAEVKNAVRTRNERKEAIVTPIEKTMRAQHVGGRLEMISIVNKIGTKDWLVLLVNVPVNVLRAQQPMYNCVEIHGA